MSSPLESLPPELFYEICELIDKSGEYKRQHHKSFLSLSLTSKTCRSYATLYIFRRLFFKEYSAGKLTRHLTECVQTLSRLGVLHLVRSVDISFCRTNSFPKTRSTMVIELLKQFPNLIQIYAQPRRVLTKSFIDEKKTILVDRAFRADKEGRYLWMYRWSNH
ncbi:hypothetical protein KCU65_g9850, partial [Aureobasidium melanogenum]